MDNGTLAQTRTQTSHTIADRTASSAIKLPTPKGISVKILNAMEKYRMQKRKKIMNGGTQATSSLSASAM